ncbi:hypothetical protein [Alkalihalobacillus deserti]|uniref:hypothetical protein n=1 Tax=Alkalihalobacillus deserti TaxID=2879466 RepID=UPI001D137F77|nr:hypothetical protein [Alkalihalobacillus deserti]
MVHNTGESFEDIVKGIQTVSLQTQEVTSTVIEVNYQSHIMVKLIENIALITQQTSGSTQQVAASIEEQTVSMQEISSAITMLNNITEELEKDIKRFKI